MSACIRLGIKQLASDSNAGGWRFVPPMFCRRAFKFIAIRCCWGSG